MLHAMRLLFVMMIALVAAVSGTAAQQDDPTPEPESPRGEQTRPSDEQRTITVGEPLRDEINAGRPIVYFALTAEADLVYQIEVTSEMLDTYLVVLDASGETLADDDDSGMGLNARIASFRPPADGTYTLQVTTFEARRDRETITPGTFTLSVTQDTRQTLAVGEPLTGELDISQSGVDFPVMMEAGTVYQIDAASDDFDTYLLLLGTDGTTIAEDDDSGTSINSRLIGFSPPESGLYTVRVTSFSAQADAGNNASGTFTVSVETVTISQIEYDTVEVGTLSGEPTAIYQFEGRAGDEVILQATSDTFDTTLTLSYDGAEVAYDDDGGDGSNSLIGPIMLTDTGTYTVSLASYFGDTANGTYTLSLLTVQSVAYEPDGVRVRISPDAAIAIAFDAQQGDLMDFSVIGEPLAYSIVDAFGFKIATANPSTNTPQLRSVYIEADGEYRLLLLPEANTETTIVRVVIDMSEPQILEAGSNVITLNMAGEGFVQFGVEAGEPVQLTFVAHGTDSSVSDLSVDVQLDGDFIGYYGGYGGDSFSFVITFERDGEADLFLTEYNGPGAYEITLERLTPEDK